MRTSGSSRHRLSQHASGHLVTPLSRLIRRRPPRACRCIRGTDPSSINPTSAAIHGVLEAAAGGRALAQPSNPVDLLGAEVFPVPSGYRPRRHRPRRTIPVQSADDRWPPDTAVIHTSSTGRRPPDRDPAPWASRPFRSTARIFTQFPDRARRFAEPPRTVPIQDHDVDAPQLKATSTTGYAS